MPATRMEADPDGPVAPRGNAGDVEICEQCYAPQNPKVEKFLPSNRRDFGKNGKVLHIIEEQDFI